MPHSRTAEGERPPQYADGATKSPLDAQEAYAFWIAGFILLAIVVGRMLRNPPPPLRLPRPTAAQVSTLLAWLIIAGIVAVVLMTRHG